MNIIGINAFHGDSSAALLSDGLLATAIEEERLLRVKHWAGLPTLSVRECLRVCGPEPVQHVAISRDPRAHLWRKLLRVGMTPRKWDRLSSRGRNSLRIVRFNEELKGAGINLGDARIHFVEHHRAHLASAFFCSPFEHAAVVSVDGFGDFSSVMWGIGRGNKMDVRGSVLFPHSLGIFYTAFTQFLGFPKYGDEYKMMGLAAYGQPGFANQVRNVLRVKDGQVELDLNYFVHHTFGVDMTWDGTEPVVGRIFSEKMTEVFGAPRAPRSEVTQRDSDLAASVQQVLEESYFALLNYVQAQTGELNLCLAGGVALNCAANGKLAENTRFRNFYVQPAAHDAGTSIGAALYAQHQILHEPRKFIMDHAYYGPEYTDAEIAEELEEAGVVYQQCSENELIARTAEAIASGKIVGWFQGRMEFGPRALGNRSILADPSNKQMKDILNSRIKYREPFRPFCPSILAEASGEYFEDSSPAPFMVTAYRIKPHQRSRIPAVTHADGTGRLQTVEKAVNPLYWKLIKHFGEITGVPILLNTSFNENEPIVTTPHEALDCFLRTQMDVLAMGSYFMVKSENAGLVANRRPHALAEHS